MNKQQNCEIQLILLPNTIDGISQYYTCSYSIQTNTTTVGCSNVAYFPYGQELNLVLVLVMIEALLR